MADIYHYQPILESGWIRLLHILPGAGDDRLGGTLEQVHLTERERYETLSYTWGQEKAKDSVFVEGKLVAVTPNCSNAIRNLRRAVAARTFWIDAVCINQGNKDEKAQQFSMMGDIYARSQRTVVYLGPEDASVRLLRDNMQTKPGTVTFPPELQAELEDARQRLLGRHWYFRKWIIQEVLLSREVIVQAGRQEFKWAELEILDNRGLEIVKLAKKYLHPSSLSSMAISGQDWDPKAKAAWEEMFEQGEVIAMEHQRFTNQANLPRYSKYRLPQKGFLMPPQLFDVLCLTSNFACKEPLDRLFAVLSLFVRKMDIVLDYACDENQVYQSLTKELLSLGDTRMFWLEDRDSWKPRWPSALSTLADFVRTNGETDRGSRPATDIGRLMKEVHQEKRVGAISVPTEMSWKVQGVLLGRITTIADQAFECGTVARPDPSSESSSFNQHKWNAALKSLGLDRTAPHENGTYPLAHA
ncbi:hypothetical protein PRZ48_001946 [Zasmidium cellare]|uniref:Heterokaryon incompatibility domain-containing protein n=1 Tax=Zasmidium cellare TaxID=395010 RepID=A0ABR0F584_ZASCE|nr:hypothetical protein PRZ48_001946 [Zasmidium cellare]